MASSAKDRVNRLYVNRADANALAPLPDRLLLECGSCGHRARYDVGTVLLTSEESDAAIVPGNSTGELVCFTDYFHCELCDAADAWKLTKVACRYLRRQRAVAALGLSGAGVYPALPVLFDGTICRSPAWGEDYLRARIAESPNDFFLYNRLGNLLSNVDFVDDAIEAYDQALALNPKDSDSHLSLGRFAEEDDELEEAILHYQLALRFASHCDHIPPDVLRAIVRESLERLFDLHDPEDGADFIPGIEPIPEIADELSRVPPDERVVHAFSFDLSTDEGWERMVDMYAYGTRLFKWRQNAALGRAELPPEVRQRHDVVKFEQAPSANGNDDIPRGNSADYRDRRIPLNRPCPCGSGKKAKHCCSKKS